MYPRQKSKRSRSLAKQIAAPMLQKPDVALPQLRPPDAEGKDVELGLSELTLAKTDIVSMQAKMTVKMGTSAEWNIASDAGNPGPLVNAPGGQLGSVVQSAGKDDSKDGHVGWNGPSATERAGTLHLVTLPVSGAGANQLRKVQILDCRVLGVSKYLQAARPEHSRYLPMGTVQALPMESMVVLLGGGVAGGGGRGGTGSGFGGGGNIASIQIPGMSVKGGPNTGAPTVAGSGTPATVARRLQRYADHRRSRRVLQYYCGGRTYRRCRAWSL